MQATQEQKCTTGESVLAVSLELSQSSWKVALHDGQRDKAALYTLKSERAGERLQQVIQVIEQTQKKWGLSERIRVVVVYEAGQDGFWIGRALAKVGYQALMVDGASILVQRQARRAKTDRLDAIALVMSVRSWLAGERGRMRVVHEPEPDAEAQRHLTRERGQLQKEVQQHRDRLVKLLRTVGCWDSAEGAIADRLKQGDLRCYDGTALPAELQQRLEHECERMALVLRQLAQLEAGIVAQLPEAQQQRIAQLMQLKAVGRVGALRLVLELYWRDFDNRRQVGACVGLAPQPYDSGQSRVDQGISKQGNRRVRALLIEMAWMWLRYQPHSALAQWFTQRTQGSGPNKRARRIAIVAVARRLAIALWRYLEHGVVPNGAQLKAA
jgi:transposase